MRVLLQSDFCCGTVHRLCRPLPLFCSPGKSKDKLPNAFRVFFLLYTNNMLVVGRKVPDLCTNLQLRWATTFPFYGRKILIKSPRALQTGHAFKFELHSRQHIWCPQGVQTQLILRSKQIMQDSPLVLCDLLPMVPASSYRLRSPLRVLGSEISSKLALSHRGSTSPSGRGAFDTVRGNRIKVASNARSELSKSVDS